MDLQRSLLIGALAVLSFMLLTKWVDFKDTRTAADSVENVRLSADPAVSTPELPVASVAEPASSSSDDLPSVTDSAPATAAPAVASTGNARIVQVHTDVLQLAIDLTGGDIVELALPKFPAELAKPEVPFILLEQNDTRTYIAQSGLIGTDGIDKDSRPTYTAATPFYRIPEGENELVVDLLWQNDSGIKVTKRLTLTRGEYLVRVDYLVENGSKSRWQANLFGQLKRDNSPTSSTAPGGMGLHPFLGAALSQPDEHFTKFTFEQMAEEPFKATLPGGWIAIIQHYFLSAWIPDPAQSHTFSTRVTNAGFNIAGFTSPALVIEPGQRGQVGANFYGGPKDQYRLKEISPYLDLSVDYGWLWWIAQPLFWLLTKIYSFVGNWGVAIILLTVTVKAAFFKLSATSYRSMANMRRVQPKMVEIREQFADDKQKQSQAMMELYRKEKINPMGGCLPILVQMPVFIALYWVLMESVELRQAPFILWIDDLSVMDPYFVLPLMMGASMFFMQMLNPPPPDPMQAKIMKWMPIVFTFFFLWFPAGLVLYWVVNNLLSMAQQYVITKKIEAGAAKS
ncbi:MAG: membrane protein insertase YidC [Halioglobus sp.]|nr:membrane protein insertase YidC [Halioglobus sp.]